jgi:hypothetical protein
MQKQMKSALVIAAAAGLAAASQTMAQYSVVSNIGGTFVDISTTGTFLGGGDDSAYAQAIAAAQSNALFPPGTLSISTNGGLGYNTDTNYANVAIPSTGYHAGGIGFAPFWDDLITNAAGAGIYTQVIGNTLIIQWQAMDAYPSSTTQGTFQVQIFGGGSGPGGALAQMLYQNVLFGTTNDNGASATIGYQADATTGSQYSFDTASIQNGTVLSLLYTGTTGACCSTSGSCSIAASQACTGAGGTYRGDGTNCATANCPQPCPPITGMLVTGPATWPVTHVSIPGARLFRDGVPDTCAAPGSPAGSGAGPYNADVYQFQNNSNTATCVSLTLNAQGQCNLYAGAYIPSFDPNNVVTNNVASTGVSTAIPPAPISMSFNVPANATFQIVVNDTNAVGVSTCADSYTFQIAGGALSCASVPQTCYPNCDASTTQPCLNVLDFSCFLNQFAAGSSYANCDNSTTVPVLNVLDFGCFLNRFAGGCSGC